MRLYVVPLALLFIALSVPSSSYAQSVETTTAGAGAGAGDDELVDATPYVYDVGRAILLNCSGADVPPGTVYTWSKNGTGVEQLEELKGRYETLEGGAVLRVKPRTTEDDYGDYACAVGGGAVERAWRVVGRPVAKLPANVNVVEGQKLKVTCKVIGKPYPRVRWLYAPAGGAGGENASVALETGGGGRVSVRASAAGVPDGELLLEAAERGDAGEYTCAPPAGLAAHTTLRVKGMYDALWPFLGICAEVFVLCAIILVYEKRRTKPELDDSDTDNHDQKKS